MAVVTAGANVALDMRSFEIADLDGTRTYAGVSHIELKHGTEYYTDVYGDFYYDAYGEVYSGSVYEVTTSYYSSIDYSITGLNINAGDFFDWVYFNDTDYAFSVMFAGADTFYGSDRADWLESFGGNDRLYGYGGADSLFGGAGSDYLDGGSGDDYMAGGSGDDTYVVTSMGDRVIENSGEGFDLVYSSVAYSLEGSYVEDLTLTGSANISAVGSSFNNILIGNSGSNFIDGKGGADFMEGGVGNDVYVVDNVGDRVVEYSGEGFDLVRSSVAYSLEGSYVEDLTLTGSANISAEGSSFNNILIGNSGSNFIDGKGGADLMEGGVGNDVYVVDNVGDRVVEYSGEGFDLVRSSISYALTANVEDLTLTGSANINATGNGLNNILTGNAGANVLAGGAGNDTLIGGKGNDTYYVDSNSDVVTEKKGDGADLIVSSVSFVMKAGSYVENLTLSGSSNINGSGNGIANVITGNAGKNVIDGGAGSDKLYGNAGNDTLNGGTSGSDKMYGGTGNDVFYVNSSGDKAYEEKNEGTDHVYSTVNYKLTGEYIEYLTLTGSADVYAKGNSLDNRLVGNKGDNKINGMEGQDRLTGGGGSDTFIWDATSHSKVNDSDRIVDLSSNDFIDLSRIDANTTTGGTQHFVLVDAFTHTAGQVTLTFDGTYTNLNADTNGDGVSDMLVRIDGDHEDFDNFIFGGG